MPKFKTSVTAEAGATIRGDAAMRLVTGVLASRPAASSTNNGMAYFSTDDSTLYLSNGSSWATVSSGGTQSSARSFFFS